MSRVIHTCTGCVPIDASIIEAYVALVTTNKNAAEAEEGRVAAELVREGNESERISSEALRESQASSDHSRAEGDHGTATSDHSRADSDHGNASQDSARAVQDHIRAEQDHSASETATTRANAAAEAAEHQVDVKRGYGIKSVTQPVVATTNGGENTIRVTTDDDRIYDFIVRNGKSSAGFFATSASLAAAIPSPNVGDYAFVSKAADGTFPAYIYVCATAGTWTPTTAEYDGDSVDLTPYATKDEVSQLGQKVAAPGFANLNFGQSVNLVPNIDGIIQGGINDSTGDDASTTSSYRLRTAYIAVTDTRYISKQLNGWGCEVLCYKYENDAYTYLGYSSGYYQSGKYEYKSGTTHIRLMFKYGSPEEVIAPNNGIAVNVFICDYSLSNEQTKDDISAIEKDIDHIHNRMNVVTDIDAYKFTRGKYVNVSGGIAAEASTYITAKIPIAQGDKILWNFGGSTHIDTYALVIYNASDEKVDFYRDSNSRYNTPITAPANSAYFIATMSLVNYTDGWIKVNGTVVWAFPSCFEENNASNIQDIYRKLDDYDKFQNCYVNQYWSAYDARTNANGYIASYIFDCPISYGDTVEWGIADGSNPSINVRINFYNSAGGNVNWWGSSGGTNGIRTSDSFPYNNVAKVSLSGVFSKTFTPYLKVNGVLVYKAVPETGKLAVKDNILHLKVAQWNIGNLNYGSAGPMPDASLETAIPLLKEIFTKSRADILFINECQRYINQGDDGETQLELYPTLLKQFYPYYITLPTSWLGCFSKVNFLMEDVAAPTGGSRGHKFGVVTINGLEIGIAFVHCSPTSVSERVAELTAIAGEFSTLKYGIIVGDTNITNNSETQSQVEEQVQPLLDAGFTFGNMGYWGLVPTLSFNPNTPTVGPTRATDNIIVKGFNIDFFEAFVDKDNGGNYKSYYSDHYPIRAEISTFTGNN